MTAEGVQAECSSGVAIVRLCRPEKRNALTTAMYERLAAILQDLRVDTSVRIVVLTGSGGSFTAGNDLDEMMRSGVPSDAAAPRRFLDALVAIPQVLIVAVDGPAIGVGTTLLLHADLAFATRTSVFAMPFVNLGLVPEAAATLLLPAAIGHVKAAELMLLGRRIGAAEAAALGLVNEVIEGGQSDLDEHTAGITAALAAQPAAALLHTRRLLREHRIEATRLRLAEDGALLTDLIRARAAS